MFPEHCDFCGSDQFEETHRPSGSQRGSVVVVCDRCGLVFTRYENVPYSREPRCSGDADWGNIRMAKGFRLDSLKPLLIEEVRDAKTILDVGSSRGDFVRFARKENPLAHITAIEPDERIIDYAEDADAIPLKLENVCLRDNNFDFVFLCQTLEHADAPSKMLSKIWKAMKPGGTLFLEVPNLDVIRYPWNVECHFIDKHTHHFSHNLLCNYVEWAGFRVSDTNLPNDLNVRIVASKGFHAMHPFAEWFGSRLLRRWGEGGNAIGGLPDRNKKLIRSYAATISRNRAKLPAVVAKINRLMDVMKVSLWGGTTIFDLLVKAGLDPGCVQSLVDTWAWKYVHENHGVKVQAPETLRVFQPDCVIVLARFSEDAIVEAAKRYNVRNVIKFSDLLRSVRA